MIRCSLKPYKGDKDYIFISYSHKDSDRVFPIIEKMAERGYRIWYDEGINPGSEWPETIANNLNACGAFVAFISDNYMESHNCRREVNFAIMKKKPFLSIYLEDIELSLGMEMQLSAVQSLHKYALPDDEIYFERLSEANILENCLGDADEMKFSSEGEKSAVKDSSDVSTVDKNAGGEKKAGKASSRRKIITAAVIAVILAAIAAVILIFALGGGKGTNGGADSKKDSKTVKKEIVMSDELDDFTFMLDGKVYSLPTSLSEFESDGWTRIDQSLSSDGDVIAGYGEAYVGIIKNGTRVYLGAHNFSGNKKDLSECEITRIDISKSGMADFSIAKGIGTSSGMDDIVSAFGDPDETNSYGEDTEYRYNFNDSGTSFAEFRFYSSYNEMEISLENVPEGRKEKTETIKEVPDYISSYEAPKSLEDDFKSFAFSLDGKLYSLPAPLTEFTDDGWKVTNRESFVAAGQETVFFLEKDSYEVNVTVKNFADYQTVPENCAVTEVDLFYSYGYSGEMPKGFIEISGGVKNGIDEKEADELMSGVFKKTGSSDGSSSILYSYYPDEHYIDCSIVVYLNKDEGLVDSISITNRRLEN